MRVKDLIIKKIKELNLDIDEQHYHIMRDMFRVYAAPFSIKPNGNIVTPLDKDDFMNKDIFTLISSDVKKNKVIEAKADDTKVATVDGVKPFNLQPYRVGQRDDLSSQLIYYRFVSNKIAGLKNNYITVITIDPSKFTKKTIDNLRIIQSNYNLSDFYIFKVDDIIYCINFKIVQKERLIKIMKKAKSNNLSYFLTRGHAPIRINDSIKFIGKIDSAFGQEHKHSEPHCDLFGVSYKNMTGLPTPTGIMTVKVAQ
jgi:hypothetical protein